MIDNAQLDNIGRQCDRGLHVVPPGMADRESLKHIRDALDGQVQRHEFRIWEELAMEASKPLPDNQTYPLYFF